MAQPDLRGVKRVKEDEYYKSVNEALSQGWKLLDAYVTEYGLPKQRQETIHYVLVWDLEGDPPPEHDWGIQPRAFSDIVSDQPNDDGHTKP